MLRRLESVIARFRSPRPSHPGPRTPHLAGIILTAGLLVGLVGTLVLTFAVALSASSNKSGSSSPVATIAAPTGNQPDTVLSPIPADETTDVVAEVEEDDGREAEPTAQAVTTAAEISAKSAFALDVKSGKALATLNADERRPMASLTKMVTALVITKALDDDLISLNESVTIEESDIVDPTIYSHMGLEVGDTVTIEQLLDGMLIPSGNDAAKALARHVGERLPGGDDVGPRSAFVTAMNDVVADLGLLNTAF